MLLLFMCYTWLSMCLTQYVPCLYKWLRNCKINAGYPNIGVWNCQAKPCCSRGKNTEGICKHPASENWAGKFSKLWAWTRMDLIVRSSETRPVSQISIIVVHRYAAKKKTKMYLIISGCTVCTVKQGRSEEKSLLKPIKRHWIKKNYLFIYSYI